jgi:N-acetylneuraminate synthase
MLRSFLIGDKEHMTTGSNTWLHDPVNGKRCTIVGEIAQAHDGSLGMAHAYIDAVATAGADAVKFQTHIAAAESTPSEPWRTRFSPQDESRYEYWRRMEFTPEQWHGLKAHADDTGLLFLSSPFSMEATDLLTKVGVAGWKIASGEVTNFPMVERMCNSGLPVMLSTGMSPLDEVDEAVALINSYDVPLAVMQCTTQYPSPPDSIGLNVLGDFRDRYGGAVGLSDHSGQIYPSLAAATMGADIIEIHVTMSREMFGPDVKASVTTEELKQITDGVRFIAEMTANPVDKTKTRSDIAELRDIFFKSLVPCDDLPAATVLEAKHITAKKPGTGIPATQFKRLIGRTLARNVQRDRPFVEEDFER